jgi:hypothetical protein
MNEKCGDLLSRIFDFSVILESLGTMTRHFGSRFVTAESICAVRIQDGTTGLITRIPRHSTIRSIGISRLPQMVEIEWQGERFAVFDVDLQSRCTGADPGRPLPMGQVRIA